MVEAPLAIDQLWPSLATAEKASRRGTDLLKELHRLLVRGDPLSDAWFEDRLKILDAIEAHLAAITVVEAGLDTAEQTAPKTEGQPVELPSAEDVSSNKARVA